MTAQRPKRAKSTQLLAAIALLAATVDAGAEPLTMQGPGDKVGPTVPQTPLGKPCLDIEAASRAQIINPSMIDHIVSMKNECSRTVKAKVCYYGSDRCRELDVQPYKRVDAILGTMMGVKFFRYSISQK